jgi:hypothetical protein
MISTGTLMLGKALLTAAALLGFGFWQLAALRRLRREREQRQADAHSQRPNDEATTPARAKSTEAETNASDGGR